MLPEGSFRIPNQSVDGMACGKCRSYGFCRCRCVTHMREMRYRHCCELFCIEPARDICLLCEGTCYCLCATLQKEYVRDAARTLRINGKLVELVTVERPSFCCPKECFHVPDQLIRGLACTRCKAVNFCKCDCVTWQEWYPVSAPKLKVYPGYYARKRTR